MLEGATKYYLNNRKDWNEKNNPSTSLQNKNFIDLQLAKLP